MENNPKDDQKQTLSSLKDEKNEQESNEVPKKIESPISTFINHNSGSSDFSNFSFLSPTNSFSDSDPIKFNTQNLPQYNFDSHSLFDNMLSNTEQIESTKTKIPSIFNFIKDSSTYSRLPTSLVFSNPAPYVGLLNQGSTCYMNSLLQALFHLPAFRRLVFEINDQNISKPDSENIPLNLKLLFAKMQLHKDNKAISTEDLTTSFGWKEPQTFMQHDVQEFSRVLLENLEEKMKGTPLEKSINYIFGGNYITFIYTYAENGEINNEKYINNEFYDISLDVSNEQTNGDFQPTSLIDDIYSAFDKYTEEEKLSGENQYQSEESTKKDAFIRNKFYKMPRVLYLHLKRFQIDLATNQSIKINSFFRFYKTINLTKYVADEILESTDSDYAEFTGNTEDYESDKYQYDLFGILVHSGTSISGHYMAYLKPKMEDKWYQFNDSFVKEVDEETAINENFGGVDKTSSAYMLIYIKRTDEENLFHEVENEAIPKEIIDRIDNKTKQNISSNNSDSQALNENNDNKVTFYLFTEENTVKKNAFSGKLSFACDREYATQLPMYKTNSLNSLHKNVSELFQKNENQIELWPQFLNEGLIEKLENTFYKDLSQYPTSMNVFVLIKNNDLNHDIDEDSSVEMISNNLSANDSITDLFNSDSSFSLNSMSNILNSSFSESTSTVPIFVFIYCSLSKNPFSFLFSYEVDSNKSILNFLAFAVLQKLKYIRPNDEDFNDIDYIKKIMTIYIKKPNNILEKIDKNEEKFSSCIKNDEIFKSVIFVIELEEWTQFEIPQVEDDSYAMDIYLSQKKQENSDNHFLMKYNYIDYNKFFNHQAMSAQQYYNYINDLNEIKIISFGKKIVVTFPNLISISDFKIFLKLIFEKEIKSMIHANEEDDGSINYDELLKLTEALIFRENEVNSIFSKENDPMLTILTPTDKKLKIKFIDPSLLLINESILSCLLLEIFVSFDSFTVEEKTEEFVKKDSTVSDVISLIKEKYFSNSEFENNDEFELRALQLGEKGRKILRIIDQTENTASLMNPIRIEKVAKSRINDAKSFIKVNFEKKLKFDPFIIEVTNDMKLDDVKEIITENAKKQKQAKKTQIDDDDKNDEDLSFSFYNEKGERMPNLSNDAAIVDLTPQLIEILVEYRKIVKLIDRSVHLYN